VKSRNDSERKREKDLAGERSGLRKAALGITAFNGAPRSSKQRGEWVELKFMTRAAEEGLVVAKPWGDSARYDFVVEHAGKLRRVQVKCASWGPKEQRKRGGYRCHVTSRRFCWKTKKFGYRPYTKSEIEFFAIYVLPEDTWFIVPMKRVTYSMLLCPREKDSRYYQYREAWGLLRE
jgi:hypothetical protein